MDYGLCHVQKLVFIDGAVDPGEVSGHGAYHCVSDKCGGQKVYRGLAVGTEVYVSVSAGGALNGKEHVEDKRVEAVIVKALSVCFIKYLVAAVLNV